MLLQLPKESVLGRGHWSTLGKQEKKEGPASSKRRRLFRLAVALTLVHSVLPNLLTAPT